MLYDIISAIKSLWESNHINQYIIYSFISLIYKDFLYVGNESNEKKFMTDYVTFLIIIQNSLVTIQKKDVDMKKKARSNRMVSHQLNKFSIRYPLVKRGINMMAQKLPLKASKLCPGANLINVLAAFLSPPAS